MSSHNYPTNDEKDRFSKVALAMRYHPGLAPSTALRYFNRELQNAPALARRLREMGYTPQTKVLTPRLIRIITDFLGEP